MDQGEKKSGFYSEYNITPTILGNYPSLKKYIRTFYDKLLSLYSTKLTKESVKEFCNNYIPITLWGEQYIKNWNKGWLFKDLIAGITVAILEIPQGMSYAQIAGFPPINGIYASAFPVFAFGAFSSARIIVAGPVAADSLMMRNAITSCTNAEEGSDEYLRYGFIISFAAGISLILACLLRCGFITRLMSRPVMQGFVFASAVLIICNQLKTVLGISIPQTETLHETLEFVIPELPNTNIPTLVITIVSLILLLIPKFYTNIFPKWFPTPLFIMIIAILFSEYFNFKERYEVKVVGEIPQGIPKPTLPDFSLFFKVFPYAALAGIVGYMDAISMTVGIDQKVQDRYRTENRAYNEKINKLNNNNDRFNELNNPVDSADSNLSTRALLKHPNSKSNFDFEEGKQGAQSNISIANDDDNDNDNNDSNNNNDNNNNDNNSDDGKKNRNNNSNNTNNTLKLFSSLFSKCHKKEKNKIVKPLTPVNVKLDASQEMLAYGIGDVIASFFQSQIISGSFSRTALLFDMEGHTLLANFIAGIICLIFLSSLAVFLESLPKCVLSAIILSAIYRLILDGLIEIRFLYYVSRIELIEYLAALLLPLFIDIYLGIIIAIFISLLVRVYKTSDAPVLELGQIINNNQIYYANMKHWNDAKSLKGIKIVELRSELTYTNYNILIDYVKNLLNYDPSLKFIIICLVHTQSTDSSSLRSLITLFEDVPHVTMCLSHVRKPVRSILFRYEHLSYGDNSSNNNNSNLIKFPKNVKIFISTHDAVLYCQKILNQSDVDNNNNSNSNSNNANDNNSNNNNNNELDVNLRNQCHVRNRFPNIPQEENLLLGQPLHNIEEEVNNNNVYQSINNNYDEASMIEIDRIDNVNTDHSDKN